MARRIRFIADDLGLDAEVNEAIRHTHVNGALHGAGLMMGQPGTEAAVAMARAHPTLAVGWHLHLNDSRPCTLDRWPWGSSPARAGFAIGLVPRLRELARLEIRSQWRAFLDTGLPCRFVNAHHHLHVHPMVRKMLLETLEGDFNGWVRWGTPRFFGTPPSRVGYGLLDRLLHAPQRGRIPYPLSTTVWGIDRTFAMDADEIQSAIPALGEGLHEFIFHPRTLDSDADTRCLIDLGAAGLEPG
jgi:hypothetical protein